MAGDILFFSLAGPQGNYTGAHTVVFSAGFFLYIILQMEERSCNGQVGGALYLLGVPNSLQG
jgi:hypothetical protein